MRDVTTISVPRPRLRTGKSNNHLMLPVFRHEIEGWQDEHGRWRVSADQVERLVNIFESIRDELRDVARSLSENVKLVFRRSR
jgi:hypothetical protein